MTSTITTLGTIDLPVEMYTDARVAEFDAAEAELATVLQRKRRTPHSVGAPPQAVLGEVAAKRTEGS